MRRREMLLSVLLAPLLKLLRREAKPSDECIEDLRKHLQRMRSGLRMIGTPIVHDAGEAKSKSEYIMVRDLWDKRSGQHFRKVGMGEWIIIDDPMQPIWAWFEER